MFCCSPVALEILNKILTISPDYIVLVFPRKNFLYRKFWRVKSKIRNLFLKIKSKISIYYFLESEITDICNKKGYKKDFHSYRYVWETVIYKKEMKSNDF